MKYGHNRNPQETVQKRKLKTKPLLVLIAILFIGNVFWFVGWLIPDKKLKQPDEVVASVAGDPITREQWMTAMEKAVGRDVLRELVNNKVMETAAAKYGIEVSEKELELELALITSVDGHTYSGLDLEQIRQRIRSTVTLEKVLSNDVVIDDATVKSFYDENESLYTILTAYRTSIIVVPSKKEAERALSELSKGSSFDALAKEVSMDLTSANLGGDIGYINADTETIDPAIYKAASQLKEGRVGDAVGLKDGTYAIVQVNEVINGREFTFDEVKEHIKRELTIEQLSQLVLPEAFWKEFDAKWFYGK
ncbi:peptidyl-prolyl cis-trans isomerase [Sporosarcina thermotolerans]|uniref:peptidylprolyl isomerase n=1 Tax=Sporosarcina thermotolerans TaxID=633404 RepID=A0AAW9AET0_9BACL|nr:peptidyl-prolyl cis-trans isomerase [Sporosarcina thermotolerans]MDW0118714.1 peptidyl-prolyl cis-trans isomerase [Sporosarcina thermotolerans]WHT48641.1 peptidyl-prolyl cis-trans isomerase [Sporosarcina thermotolerans]